MKFKKLFFTLALTLSCFLSFSQSESSFFSTLIRSRGFYYPYTNFSITAPNIYGIYMEGMSLFGFEYGLRKNIKDIDANNTLSLAIYPSLHASLFMGGDAAGFGSFSLPLLFEYNQGNVSSWDADLDKGFVLGLGLDFRVAPLILIDDSNDPKLRPNQAYVQGMAKIGYRYWGRNNKPKEVSLKLGFGLTSNPVSSSYGSSYVSAIMGNNARAFSLEFCWSRFLNY